MQLPLLVDQQHVEFIAAKQMLAALKYLVEHRLRIGYRVADHAQDLGRRLLLL